MKELSIARERLYKNNIHKKTSDVIIAIENAFKFLTGYITLLLSYAVCAQVTQCGNKMTPKKYVIHLLFN